MCCSSIFYKGREISQYEFFSDGGRGRNSGHSGCHMTTIHKLDTSTGPLKHNSKTSQFESYTCCLDHDSYP